PALAAGMAALFLMIPLARRLLGGTAWIWPVALCAVSNHALAHAYQVKPYSSDLLVTLLVLLAALVYLSPESTSRSRRCGLIGILFAGVLAPWFSFPSAFILGGVSLAWFVQAI